MTDIELIAKIKEIFTIYRFEEDAVFEMFQLFSRIEGEGKENS